MWLERETSPQNRTTKNADTAAPLQGHYWAQQWNTFHCWSQHPAALPDHDLKKGVPVTPWIGTSDKGPGWKPFFLHLFQLATRFKLKVFALKTTIVQAKVPCLLDALSLGPGFITDLWSDLCPVTRCFDNKDGNSKPCSEPKERHKNLTNSRKLINSK